MAMNMYYRRIESNVKTYLIWIIAQNKSDVVDQEWINGKKLRQNNFFLAFILYFFSRMIHILKLMNEILYYIDKAKRVVKNGRLVGAKNFQKLIHGNFIGKGFWLFSYVQLLFVHNIMLKMFLNNYNAKQIIET